MILHGNLVFGAPRAWYNWPTFFNSVSYLINFESITLAELEHTILRAPSSKPSPILSKIIIPSASFPKLQLTKKDFRLSFCLNCGAKSCLRAVPIFKSRFLDEQFDEITRQFISEAIEIDDTSSATNISITLPILCSWYVEDFVPQHSTDYTDSRSSDHDSNFLHCLRTISPYVSEEDKIKLNKVFNKGMGMEDGGAIGDVTFKFHGFNYQCLNFVELKNVAWNT